MSGRRGDEETKRLRDEETERLRDLKPCYSVVKNGMRNGI